MKKKPSIFKKIRLDFTQDNFYISVGDDLIKGLALAKKTDKRLKICDIPPNSEHCEALCFTDPSFGALVLFRHGNLQASYICHEVSHASRAMLQHIGIPLSDDTDEVYAYHNDMLFRFCVQFMKKNKLKIKL